ncbi:MAG: O-antigen ligase family protein [Verrucomicrobiota bacterium]
MPPFLRILLQPQWTLDQRIEKAFMAGIFSMLLGSYFGIFFIEAGQVFFLGAFGLFLWSYLRKEPKVWDRLSKWPRRRFRLSSWFLALLVIGMVSSLLANLKELDSLLLSLKKVRYHVGWLIPLSLVFFRMVPERMIPNWGPILLVAWISSLVLATLAGMAEEFLGFNPLVFRENPEGGRGGVGGVHGTVMTYAYSLQFSFLLLVALALGGLGLIPWPGEPLEFSPWLTRLIWIALATSILGLYLSGTRGALVGAGVGFFILAIVWRRWWLLGAMVLVVGIAATLATRQDSRLVTEWTFKSDSMKQRVDQWEAAWLTFREYPVFGVGYRQFEERSVELKRDVLGLPPDDLVKEGRYFKGHAHNDYLESLASTGIIGGILYLGFLGSWFREVACGRLSRKVFLPVLGAFLVSSFFQNVFTDSEVLNFVLLIYFASQILIDWEEQQIEGVA